MKTHNFGSKFKKAYIAWEDEDTSSTLSDAVNIGILNLCLIAHKRT